MCYYFILEISDSTGRFNWLDCELGACPVQISRKTVQASNRSKTGGTHPEPAKLVKIGGFTGWHG